MPIAAIPLHSIYIVVSYLGGHCVTVPPLQTLTEIRDRLKGKIFLEITMFLGQKIDKTGTESK